MEHRIAAGGACGEGSQDRDWPAMELARVVDKEEYSLNNNRNNNRRRGRNNNNRNHGGGNAANRIDSRARGNAPQLLDKYKKLAQDAQHHGDRVQAEYYLQFADHYFRVIADNKARQEEARAKRQDDRDSDDDQSGNDDNDNRQNKRRGKPRRDDQQDDGESRGKPNGRGRGKKRDDDADEDAAPREGRKGDEGEKGDNPFTKETKRPRKPRAVKSDGEIDAAALPPAIGGAEVEVETKPKRAPRRRKAADDGDAAEAAG